MNALHRASRFVTHFRIASLSLSIRLEQNHPVLCFGKDIYLFLSFTWKSRFSVTFCTKLLLIFLKLYLFFHFSLTSLRLSFSVMMEHNAAEFLSQ